MFKVVYNTINIITPKEFDMKKRIACLLALIFFVMSSFLAVGQSMSNGFGYGDSPFYNFDLTPPERNLLDLGPSTGGVAFANIAAPLPGTIAAGKPLSLRYDHNKDDGKRLEVLVGDKVINSGLYDYELVPLARFVEVDSWACMSLIRGPNENDSLAVFERAFEMSNKKVDDLESYREVAIKQTQLREMYIAKKNNTSAYTNLYQRYENEKNNLSTNDKDIFDKPPVMWASYNPAMGNTLVGLNLLLVDAMFVGSNTGPKIMNDITAQVNGFPEIPGYNDKLVKQANPSTKLLEILAKGGWGTYIFSDANYPIYYWINGDEINFSGFPFYQFMIRNMVTGKYGYVTELNNYMRLNYPAIKALNPVIYNAAERWCHWSALFKAVKTNYKGAWAGFLDSIEAVYPFVPEDPEKTIYPESYLKTEPYRITPRFWVR
jgi:hypothetical protein